MACILVPGRSTNEWGIEARLLGLGDVTTPAPVNRKVRALFLDTNDAMGGVVRVHLILLETIDRERFEPTLACLGRGAIFPLFQEIPDIDVLPLEIGTKSANRCSGVMAALANIASLLPFGGAACRLIRYCRTHAVDVVYTSDKKRALALACMLNRATRIPFVCHAHARCVDSRVTRCAFDRASVVIANSSYTKQTIIDAACCTADRIRVVPNGVSPGLFHPGPSLFRAELGIDDNRVLIGNVGRLAPDKCQEEFLRAAALVAAKHPEAAFLIVGDDSIFDDNRDYGLFLKELTNELGLSDSVWFAGFQADMPAVYNALDVVVDSCWCEGFGMVVIEAMACGKAVIGTDAGGIPDIITHGHDGFLFPPRDVAAMERLMSDLVESPRLRQTVGQRGHETVLSRFTAEAQTHAIEGILMECAAEWPAFSPSA